jgi:hypothetical protein
MRVEAGIFKKVLEHSFLPPVVIYTLPVALIPKTIALSPPHGERVLSEIAAASWN